MPRPSHSVGPNLETTSSSSSSQLPAYEPLSHALTPSAQHALNQLGDNHSLRKLKTHVSAANGAMTDMAGDINDRVAIKQALVERIRQRRRAGTLLPLTVDELEPDENEKKLDDLRSRVLAMTADMELSTRTLVDVQMHTAALEEALRALTEHPVGQGMPPTWPSTTTQESSRRRRVPEDLTEIDDEDGQLSSTTAAAGAAGPPDDAGLARLFQKDLQTRKSRFDRQTKRQKYATHNNYIGFKRIVHDALHPGEDAPPVPHPDTWFPTSPRPLSDDDPLDQSQQDHQQTSTQSGRRRRRVEEGGDHHATTDVNTNNENIHRHDDNNNGEEEEDDDDVAIAHEKISLKCPITLMTFRDPVTSNKCPHSFERTAVFEMITKSGARIGGRRRGEGQQAIQCPVCEKMLTRDDFHTNNLLLRRVRRLQQSQLNDEDDEDGDDEDDDNHGHHQMSSDQPGPSISMSSSSQQALTTSELHHRHQNSRRREGQGGANEVGHHHIGHSQSQKSASSRGRGGRGNESFGQDIDGFVDEDEEEAEEEAQDD